MCKLNQNWSKLSHNFREVFQESAHSLCWVSPSRSVVFLCLSKVLIDPCLSFISRVVEFSEMRIASFVSCNLVSARYVGFLNFRLCLGPFLHLRIVVDHLLTLAGHGLFVLWSSMRSADCRCRKQAVNLTRAGVFSESSIMLSSLLE